jgi:integrase
VDHVDAQLVLTLACFLGLGPAEIAGLEWGDVDADWIHTRRNRMQGAVTTTKNKWRAASLPIIDPVRVPLVLWRAKCEDTSDGAWSFSDLHNLVGRVIKPHVKGDRECVRCEQVPKASGVTWARLYARRRGACTMVIEANEGDAAVAQRLLRHKTMDRWTLHCDTAGLQQGHLREGV